MKNYEKIIKLKLNEKLTEEEIDDLLNSLQKLSNNELFSLFRFIISEKVDNVINIKNLNTNFKNNIFLKANTNYSIEKNKNIENLSIDYFLDNNYDFLELPPLLPLGSSYLIGKNSPNKVITTNNNCELMSDPTYGLTLHSSNILKEKNIKDSLNLFTINTAIRNQKFDNELYLPYFKILSGIKIFDKSTTNSDFEKEIGIFINEQINYLNNLKKNGLDIKKISLQLSNLKILHNILKEKKGYNEEKIKKFLYDYKKETGQNFDTKIFNDLNLDFKYKFSLEEIKNSDYYKYFKNILENIDFSKIDDFEINFSRLSGIGHYDSNVFTLFIESSDGIKTDITDGGSVDWINKLSFTNGYKQLVFGTGIELLGKNFNK